MQKTILLRLCFVATILLFGTQTVASQVCNSKLTVVKNRDSRSATVNDPTKFQLELQNNSSKSQNYTISSIVYDKACDQQSSSVRSGSTVDMNVSISQNNFRSNTITVAPGSTALVIAEVSVGAKIKPNQWYCVELVAASDQCSSKTQSKKLKVYVTDGSEY